MNILNNAFKLIIYPTGIFWLLRKCFFFSQFKTLRYNHPLYKLHSLEENICLHSPALIADNKMFQCRHFIFVFSRKNVFFFYEFSLRGQQFALLVLDRAFGSEQAKVIVVSLVCMFHVTCFKAYREIK